MNRHSHHAHSHAPARSGMALAHHHHIDSVEGSEHRLVWAMLLTGGFLIAEVVGGILSGSLALLADAGPMLTDRGALGLAHAGMRLGRRPADPQRSFGYRRLEVLAAFANGVVLLLLTLWIAIEAIRRLSAPIPVLGGPMLTISVLGLAVNL